MKKERTKHFIAETFKQMAKTKPVTQITIRELTEACEINRGTFYYQFKDIVDCIQYVLQPVFVFNWLSHKSIFCRGWHFLLQMAIMFRPQQYLQVC